MSGLSKAAFERRVREVARSKISARSRNVMGKALRDLGQRRAFNAGLAAASAAVETVLIGVFDQPTYASEVKAAIRSLRLKVKL